MNFRASGVAGKNQARQGGVRGLWRDHRRGRQRSMAWFFPQPEGTEPILPSSLSLVA